MGGINPIPNVLCVHNNVEPRSQQSPSKSRVTRKNSPMDGRASSFAAQATLLATAGCRRIPIRCVRNFCLLAELLVQRAELRVQLPQLLVQPASNSDSNILPFLASLHESFAPNDFFSLFQTFLNP
ncbi:hypothetical protein PIB30_077099 [Stylosanthes scabra]|uniref:Uncharacterized protein n=1 Tax=Stylosanthes scabra TaxID=79078 RepID=A0ABU6XNV6_9FABA|nr:hypothetical protein [Stylosanthes scabra]